MKKNRTYTDEDIIKFSKEALNLSKLLIMLGLSPNGGNYINMKRNLQRLGVDTSHWTGQGWSKDQKLKDYSQYTSIQHSKKHLLKERGHECENCHLSEWLKQPIMIEVDHIDGDRTNNAEGNLKLLCPNCHTQTPTWRNRKR